MNRSAIWYTANTLQNTWIGFSTCLSASTINATKTYYVGTGADNEFRLVLDGQVIIDTTYGSMPASDKFKYWNVYPVTIPAGNHTLELYGLDYGVVAGFGMEIYDNTLAQLTAATSTSNLNIIWSSSGYTTAEIVQDTSGYYLSSGYTCTYPAVYSVCSGGCIDYVYCDAPGITPTPTHTATQTNTPTNTSTKTPTQTQTPTPTNTATQTQTPTPSITASQTVTPTNTSTRTQTPTPSITESQTPTQTSTQTPTPTTPATIFSRSSSDYANEYFACLGSVSGIDFLYQTPGAGGGISPAVSAQMYTNPGLTNTWTPGGSGWYLLEYDGTFYAVLPNSNGVLQTVYLCGTLPSQTPTNTSTPTNTITPTRTPASTPPSTPPSTPSNTPTRTPASTPTASPIPLYTYVGRTNPEAADSATACANYQSIRGYISLKSTLASITVGDIIYDSYPFTPTNGGNNWVALKAGGVGDAYSFQIDTVGVVTTVGGNCTLPTTTPTQTPTQTPTPTPPVAYELYTADRYECISNVCEFVETIQIGNPSVLNTGKFYLDSINGYIFNIVGAPVSGPYLITSMSGNGTNNCNSLCSV